VLAVLSGYGLDEDGAVHAAQPVTRTTLTTD
jgi:hypothetical protein